MNLEDMRVNTINLSYGHTDLDIVRVYWLEVDKQ